jgi:hypothetical protein
MTQCPGRDELERLLAAPRGDGAGEELERYGKPAPPASRRSNRWRGPRTGDRA